MTCSASRPLGGLRFRFAIAWAVAGLLPVATAHAEDPPNVLSLPGLQLMQACDRLRQGDKRLQPALKKLVREAEDLLGARAPSVMDKEETADSGDKHDYLAYRGYWWPEEQPDGSTRWVRRDGEMNPMNETKGDSVPFEFVCRSVETLGLAYYFTGKPAYAKRAVLFTKTWFMNEATHMNPNFDYGESPPDVAPKLGNAVIMARFIMKVTDGLALIQDSGFWTAGNEREWEAWLGHYYDWLINSDEGKKQAEADNNHGTWYDVQVAHIALAIGRKGDAIKVLQDGLKNRLEKQVEPDGSQPYELERTNSLTYCIFNLRGLFNLARLGELVGVDWWNYESTDGRSLRAAVHYLAPYLDPNKPWIKDDIDPANREDLLTPVAQYLTKFEEPDLLALFEQFNTPDTETQRWHLLYDAEIGR